MVPSQLTAVEYPLFKKYQTLHHRQPLKDVRTFTGARRPPCVGLCVSMEVWVCCKEIRN